MFPSKAILLAATTALFAVPAAAQSGFRDCLEGIKATAQGQGVPAAIADGAFQNLTPDQKVVDLDSRQPEFTLTYGKYVGQSVTPDRVAKGQQKQAQWRGLLDSLQQEYGVPPQYLVSFWGMETNYGTFMGDFTVVRSVATLACATKRHDFFANETAQALRILADNHMTSQQMRGSWAGAMGNMQFMPSTFTKWAVDRDGNGKIDIWNSMPDAFASAANFLRGIGWKPGLPAAEEVILPRNFPLDQADSTIEKPLRAWAAMGVKRAGNAPLATSEEPAAIILPAGWRGPAFILYPNFKAVMNWNRSTLYALAVSLLAQQIAGGPQVMQPPPEDDQPLTHDTVVDLQTRLARLGFYTDEADGLLGPKTRSAVRLFQKQAGLPADGHPTPEVVARLQQTVR
ncbi:MAG: lytic murein transglycosylase [Alphaproteobacteria bacterium]|nr:lytic murein transglycosylase [Alphaproteobacteria bacterium]